MRLNTVVLIYKPRRKGDLAGECQKFSVSIFQYDTDMRVRELAVQLDPLVRQTSYKKKHN